MSRLVLVSVLASLSLGGQLAAGDAGPRYSDGSSAEVGAAEAARLYQTAVQFLKNIPEGEYSYAYVQFYWKRAEANFDRILKVYPDTPTAVGLRNGTLSIGRFDRIYFRERVLNALEEKRLATVDDVNCAYFLYNRDDTRWDETRVATMEAILEVMCRRGRWGEALGFPLPPDQFRDRFYTTIFRVAARKDNQPMLRTLFAQATPQLAELYWPILGEAQALLGKPRSELAALLDEHPSDSMKLAILQGMATREFEIRQAAALNLKFDPATGIQAPHYTLPDLEVRDDGESFARTLFPAGNAAASAILDKYRAALGARPGAGAPLAVHRAYVEYLGAFEKFDELQAYLVRTDLSAADREALQVKAVEVFALHGRLAESERLLVTLSGQGRRQADAAALAQFLGQLFDRESAFEIREKTFAELRIADPCLIAQAIMARSLAPNRPFRGPTPWDAVVFRFLPGFDNLAEPKSAEAAEAARNL